ncbi:peroxiredoxin family protein, partial [Ruminiclostridium cellobioparum]
MDLLRKFERVVKIALIVMLIVSAGLISAWLLSANKKEEPDVSLGGVAEQNEVSSNTRLADKLDLLPDKCTLNMDLSNLTFSGENGEKIALSGLRGKTVILNFWASWCPYCNSELEQWRDIRERLSQYSNVEMLLVNKLDNNKETKAQALDYLKKNQIPFENVYDEGLKVYD